MKIVTDDVIRLGRLALRFGRTMRVTYHEDGERQESDTDHTVMLCLIACAFAARFFPKLDLGKVAQFSIVHDLVEAYAGDTDTQRALDPEQKAAKGRREWEAWIFIKNTLPRLPWVADTIAEYEEQRAPEARYVRAVDKLMPKITHLLNNGAGLARYNRDTVELAEHYEAVQLPEMLSYAAEFFDLFALRKDLVDRVLGMLGRKEQQRQEEGVADEL
jgi:5'-deoxynucleotidase YfbR-like HD superfamily hydrolase